VGNHTFRATGITAYLKNGGTLESAAAMANHLDPHHAALRSPARRGEPRRSGAECDLSMGYAAIKMTEAFDTCGNLIDIASDPTRAMNPIDHHGLSQRSPACRTPTR
jgi:hypothetical protein